MTIKEKNLIIKADIVSKLQEKGALDSNDLLEIYLHHMPNMKKRKADALERISKMTFDLDKEQIVISEFDRRGEINCVRLRNKSVVIDPDIDMNRM